MQAVHVQLHTPAQVREIITEARKIADEYQASASQWYVVFEKACELLGARATTFVQPQALPLDLSALRNGG